MSESSWIIQPIDTCHAGGATLDPKDVDVQAGACSGQGIVICRKSHFILEPTPATGESGVTSIMEQ